jgi:hypothetical protein
LPEVLPEPKRVAPGAGDVRARTLVHMHRLLATAAASGSLLGCTRDAAVPSGEVREAGATGIPTAAQSARLDLPEAGVATGVPTAPPTVPPPPPTGYAVVDPVPTPAACPSLAGEVHATAHWASAPSGSAVEITMTRVTGPDAIHYGAGGTASAYGGTVLKTSGGGTTMKLLVQPGPGQATVLVAVPAQCNGRPVTVSVELDVTAKAAVGSAVPLSVSTY